MTNMSAHPWQSGPREIFEFAMNAYSPTDDARRRICFILTDVCIEMALRTYLALPEEISGSEMQYRDRRRFGAGNFHELTKGVELSAGHRFSEDAVHHVRFFHTTRNRLYHEGNGITVPEDHVRGYCTLAARLLKELLGIDGEAMLPVDWKQTSIDATRSLNEMCMELKEELDRFTNAVSLVMERFEPRMVYPSTIHRLREFSKIDITTFGSKLHAFRDLLEQSITSQELLTWLLNFLSSDPVYDPPQKLLNSQYIMELGKDPVAFYAFLIAVHWVPLEDVSVETLDSWEDISFISDDDYSIMGVYESARYISDLLNGKYGFAMNENFLLERSRELRDKLTAIIPRIEALRPT